MGAGPSRRTVPSSRPKGQQRFPLRSPHKGRPGQVDVGSPRISCAVVSSTTPQGQWLTHRRVDACVCLRMNLRACSPTHHGERPSVPQGSRACVPSPFPPGGFEGQRHTHIGQGQPKEEKIQAQTLSREKRAAARRAARIPSTRTTSLAQEGETRKHRGVGDAGELEQLDDAGRPLPISRRMQGPAAQCLEKATGPSSPRLIGAPPPCSYRGVWSRGLAQARADCA